MIVRPKLRPVDILFAMRGSIVPRIAPRVLLMAALAAAAVPLADHHPELFAQLNAAPFTLIGISLSIFMSFRNGACYERWWEARRQWGQLIVEVRSFCRETADLAEDPARRRMLLGLGGFAHLHAANLRERVPVPVEPWSGVLRAAAGTVNPADTALADVGRECLGLARAGTISEWRYTVLEGRLVSLSSVQAACERIKTTPLPFTYSLLLHRTAYLFCALLPFGLASQLGWATPVLVAIVSYTFFGLDALGDELEDPFDTEANDLPLDAMVRIIERDILAALGTEDLPEPLVPDRFLLL